MSTIILSYYQSSPICFHDMTVGIIFALAFWLT